MLIQNGMDIRALGPVFSDEAVDEIREIAEARGWEPYGEVALDSAGAFRRQLPPGYQLARDGEGRFGVSTPDGASAAAGARTEVAAARLAWRFHAAHVAGGV